MAFLLPVDTRAADTFLPGEELAQPQRYQEPEIPNARILVGQIQIQRYAPSTLRKRIGCQ
jgi:hypothetical protein